MIKLLSSEKIENRIILWIDILGFEEYIKKYEIKKEHILIDFFSDISKHQHAGYEEKISKNQWTYKPSCTIISDTIIFTFLDQYKIERNSNPKFKLLNEPDLQTIITYYANNIQYNILKKLGLLSRGVLHYGPIYHNDPIIFGSGFIRAYNLEKQEELPRIIISKELVEHRKQNIERLYNNDIKKRFIDVDENGNYYLVPLHYFSNNQREVSKEIIEQTISVKINDYSVYQKWRYAAESYNKYADVFLKQKIQINTFNFRIFKCILNFLIRLGAKGS